MKNDNRIADNRTAGTPADSRTAGGRADLAVLATDRRLRRLSDRDNDCLRLRAALAGVRLAVRTCTGPGPAYDELRAREQKLAAELKEQEVLRDVALADVQERIACVADPARQAALSARYVGFESYAQIARRLGMSKSGAVYLVRMGLLQIPRENWVTDAAEEELYGT